MKVKMNGGSDGRRARRTAQNEHCLGSSHVKSISREISGAMNLQGGKVQVPSNMQSLEKWVEARLRGSCI